MGRAGTTRQWRAHLVTIPADQVAANAHAGNPAWETLYMRRMA